MKRRFGGNNCKASNDMDFNQVYKKLAKDLEPITPKEIKSIRREYNLSQASFAKMLRISVRTLQNYEIGHRIPGSAASALFRFAKENPKVFHKYKKTNSKNFQK